MSTYKSIRSLQRGLELLSALNRQNGASAQLLADSTGIHRTTVHRILGTLQRLGYVKQSPSDNHFRLTPAVRSLSDGLDDDAWVSAVAAPVLRERHQRIMWPMNVATYDYDAMLIRESSHRYSPFAIHHATVGQRLPILQSVLGQAYIAFCPTPERRAILETLRSSRDSEAAVARDSAFVRDLVRRTRRNGYAAKPSGLHKRVSAIALPILRGKRVFATLNMVFFRSAMSIPEAVEKHLPELRKTAALIAQGLGPEVVASSFVDAARDRTKRIPEPELISELPRRDLSRA